MAAAARISVNIHELVSKNMSSVSKKGKNTSQTGKQFGKYFHCFCLAEALLAEAEVEKTPKQFYQKSKSESKSCFKSSPKFGSYSIQKYNQGFGCSASQYCDAFLFFGNCMFIK